MFYQPFVDDDDEPASASASTSASTSAIPFTPVGNLENYQHFAAIICVKNYYMMFATNSARPASRLWYFLAPPGSTSRPVATGPPPLWPLSGGSSLGSPG